MGNRYYKAQKFLKYGLAILWLGVNAILCVIMFYLHGTPSTIYLLIFFTGLGTIVIVVFRYHTFPTLIKSKHKTLRQLYLLLFPLALLGISFIEPFIAVEVWQLPGTTNTPPLVRAVLSLFITCLAMMLVASIQLTQHFYESKISEIQLEADKVTSELSILKNQINPHFLFNILNNIYGLAYMGDKKAAVMISGLSQNMRYLLYDCSKEKVPLTKERDFIKNYMNLQMLKYEEVLNVDFYHAGITNDCLIPPMIIINFVENCFKHSDVETNENAWIKISLEVENMVCRFTTENTTKRMDHKHQQGIGLANAKKLIEAYYPEHHTLEINQSLNVYRLALTIQL